MCAGVPTEHTKIRAVNGIEVRHPSRAVTTRSVLVPFLKTCRLRQVSGKAEVVAALGQPSTGTHGGAVFEFLVKRKVSKYEKAELLRVEGERLFEEKQVRSPSPASS